MNVRRRDFITLLGGAAAACPLAARAQQSSIPIVGFLSTAADARSDQFVAFRRALEEGGYVEGRNVAIEYRFAAGQYDRLPALAADLMARKSALIVASSPPAALAAKAQTVTIPIVFLTGEDPVRMGLVASLNRPGGNMTGYSFFSTELTGKRLGLLRELVPQAKAVAVLLNPANTESETVRVDGQEAAYKLGLQLVLLQASTEVELEAAFAAARQQGASALLVGNDPFFFNRRDKIVALATSHALPAMYENQFAPAGGLICYGPTLVDGYRQIGMYVVQILKGAKPAELPVQQPTRFVLSLNLKAAKALGLAIPSGVLAIADEVIE
jgi:putative ABC transport system substrate-binding protein